MKRYLPLVGLFLVPWIAPAAPNSASKSGAAVAFAKVRLDSGAILTFGGKGTKTAEMSDFLANGFVDIKFVGKYPKDLSSDQVILHATAQSSTGVNFGVANAMVLNATPTELLIRVYGWKSDTLALGAMRLFLTAFIGESVP